MKLQLIFSPRVHCDRNTGSISRNPQFPPLGIATLTGFLKKHNIKVEQDDLDIKVHHHNTVSESNNRIKLDVFMDEKKVNQLENEKYSPDIEEQSEQLLKLMHLKSPDIVGLSLDADENISTAAIAMGLGKVIKDKYGSIVIVGGQIGDNTSEQLLKSRLIDYVFDRSNVYAISELSLLGFLNTYDKKKIDLRGITHLQNGKLKFNHTNDYNKIVFTRPDYNGLPIHLYKRKIVRKVDGKEMSSDILYLPYFFVKGCPNNCAFCFCSTAPFANKNPPDVVEDILYLKKQYKTNYFYFLNSCFNSTPKYAETLCNEFIKQDLNISWTDCVHLGNLNKKLVHKLKKSGAIRLVFGVESASPRMLKYIRKPFNINKAEEMIKVIHNEGITTTIDVITGFPYETLKDVLFTVGFIKRNLRYIDDMNLYKFYLAGDMLANPSKFKIKIRDDKQELFQSWSSIPFEEEGLSAEEKIKQINKFYNMIKKTMESKENGWDTHELFFDKCVLEK